MSNEDPARRAVEAAEEAVELNERAAELAASNEASTRGALAIGGDVAASFLADNKDTLVSKLSQRIAAWVDATDGPGPDQIIDPLVKHTIRALLPEVFDELVELVDSVGE